MSKSPQRLGSGFKTVALVTALLVLPALQLVHAHSLSFENDRVSVVDQPLHSGDLTAECVLCLAGNSKVSGVTAAPWVGRSPQTGRMISSYAETPACAESLATGDPRSPPLSV